MKFNFRRGKRGDGRAIDRITRATNVFAGEELDTPGQLFDEYIDAPDDPHGYKFLICNDEKKVVGFACYGKADFTVGTYDLYWIAVLPEYQGRGAARALFAAVVAALQQEGARLLLIWTSSRKDYARARKFYERVGCELAARIADFYQPGEGLHIFQYRLLSATSVKTK